MKYLAFLFTLLFTFSAHHYREQWGKTGHRVIGDIAAHYLNKKTSKAIHHILNGESMAIAATWMDEIKSNPEYDYTHDWHWVTIPNGKTYAETKKNPNGDIISATRRIIKELKSGKLSAQKEQQDLKMLIHLVGDIHQPLHVGNGKDRGGNEVYVRWFWDSSNLHRVWDSGLIDQSKLSYSELTKAINHISKEQIQKWQNSTILDWVRESKALRNEVYDLPKDHNINYDYMYHHWQTVQKRLLQAGIRLAGVLNDIYG